MKTLIYAIRFLTRSKSYTLINLLGLAFSLACCIILMRYIHRELTVDTHCVDREQVYALITTHPSGHRNFALKPQNLGDEKNYIKTLADVKLTPKEYLSYHQKTYPTDVLAADSSYLELFDYELLQGSIIASEETASENPSFSAAQAERSIAAIIIAIFLFISVPPR